MINPRIGKVRLRGQGSLPSAWLSEGNSDEEAEEDWEEAHEETDSDEQDND